MREKRHRLNNKGFTLGEVLVAAAILSVMTLGIVQAVAAGQSRTLDALTRARADALAEVLLEELLSKPFADPDEAGAIGPEADELTRADFDNVDDYDGYTELPGELADHAGAAYPSAYQGFERFVAVVPVINSVAELGGDHAGLQVTVTVSEVGGRSWVIERFVPGDE